MRAGPGEMTIEFQRDEVEIRSARWGEMHVGRYALAPGTDLSPFFAVLPDGLCSGDHFGIVLEGEITLKYEDGTEETAREGDYYYWPRRAYRLERAGGRVHGGAPLTQVEQMEKLMAAATG